MLGGVDASAVTQEWSSDGKYSSLSVRGNGSGTSYSSYTAASWGTPWTQALTGANAYKLNSSGSVTFVTAANATVTIGVFLKKEYSYTTDSYINVDGREQRLGVSRNTTINNTATYQVVTIQSMRAGSHTVRVGDTEVGLFYIKVVSNGTVNVASVSLDDEEKNLGSSQTLGLWRSFSTNNGMTLYLGGWKYQSNSFLASKYVRHSDSYYDPDFEPEPDYENGNPNTSTPSKQVDDWEHPETVYVVGHEDPYRYQEPYLYEDGSFTDWRQLANSPANYEGYGRYAYNKVDNGRNEYIESGYTGKYRFDMDGTSETRASGDPFTVPCFGDFIKLEPTCDGTITLYLMQNGSIDFNIDNKRKNLNADDRFQVNGKTYGKWHGGLYSKINWRPVYIVDESGTRLSDDEVTAETTAEITIGRGDTEAYVYDFNNQNAVLCPKNNGKYITTGSPLGYVTMEDGSVYTGDNWWTNSPVQVRRHTYKDCFEALNSEYDIYGKKKSDSDYASDKAHYEFYTSKYGGVDVWPEEVNTGKGESTGKVGRVWGPKYTGDGWILISKGYVTYTFDVQAGKSYYLFSNVTKLGFCGYEFYAGDKPSGTITLSDADETSLQNQSIQNKSYASVTLSRKFNPGWNAICLPFSVNESQMREWFGTKDQETYELVTYSGVGTDKEDGKLKAFFFHHVYQDIIAGYPYMLWIPEGAKAINNKNQVTFTNVTMEPDAQPYKQFTDTYAYLPKELSRLHPDGESEIPYFEFIGFYNKTLVQKGDYYIVPSGLQLYNTDSSQDMKGFRAFMQLNRQIGVKDMVILSSTNFDNAIDEMESAWGNATVINEIAEEIGLFSRPSNVYSVSGQLIRANSTSLAGLPKGIYIVDGKKHLVK